MMLLDLPQTSAFLGAAILVTVAPGPDNLMVLTLGLAQGRIRGMIFGLGCALGSISHAVLAALGISALIAASPVAFSALRMLGGLYLIWLGIQVLKGARGIQAADGPVRPAGESLARLFGRGVLANAINPKVILFFLAFLPQFVVIERGMVAGQTLALGLIFAAQAAVLFCALGYFSGQVGARLARAPGLGVWLDRLAGVTFLGVGGRLLIEPLIAGA
ncbi:LysE family translocator [Pararhodospirillum oryzae]|uniref:LysE type translocator n=1 Tax=Pararhodospirillum oryzae TaxID=478448 RepID=A0A512H7J0_9PROT|nr:LysE family translocator [Pararhodospirillum oryzae]GEO81350.1 LysE type translocator [Pararhodospirillum oryzae]